MSIRPVIHWFRRDLRLRDNLALHAAIESDVPVIPLFIYDPVILDSERVGAPRLAFWMNALESLDESLRAYETWLLVRQGKPLEVLQELIEKTKARALYFNRDYSPYARRRDDNIAHTLDIDVYIDDDNLLIAPENIETGKGDPYTVYTPFMKKWKKKEKLPLSECDFKSDHFYGLQGLRNDGIDAIEKPETIELPEATEAAAQQRLDDFLADGIHAYTEQRNFLPIQPFQDNAPDGSSYLSPYLRTGLIASRTLYYAA
ncbi:MAG: deoxyribodipyrimidine photo-lyase, partial [Aggregatilineales bacterium]